MKKFGFKKSRLNLCLTGALLAGLVVLVPVICVKQELNRLLSSWQEITFYILAVFTGGAAGLLGFDLPYRTRQKGPVRLIGPLYAFLYVALCVLCQRIHLTLLAGQVWPTVGVFMIACAFAFLLWSLFHLGRAGVESGLNFSRSGPYKRIRHPGYLSLLVCAAGLPLVFGAWLPLIALPGTFVALKWRIADEEEFLSREYSEEFEDYKRATWRMVPRLF